MALHTTLSKVGDHVIQATVRDTSPHKKLKTAAWACFVLGLAIAGSEVYRGVFPHVFSMTWVFVLLAYVLRSSYRGKVEEESITVTQDLGVELRTKRVGGALESKYYDKSRISYVIINEGVTMCKVVFYMAFILKDEPNHMVVAFSHLQPRLPFLRQVYRHTQTVLNGVVPNSQDAFQ